MALRGLAICDIFVQEIAPLANDCRPVPGLVTARLGAQKHGKVMLLLVLRSDTFGARDYPGFQPLR